MFEPPAWTSDDATSDSEVDIVQATFENEKMFQNQLKKSRLLFQDFQRIGVGRNQSDCQREDVGRIQSCECEQRAPNDERPSEDSGGRNQSDCKREERASHDERPSKDSGSAAVEKGSDAISFFGANQNQTRIQTGSIIKRFYTIDH